MAPRTKAARNTAKPAAAAGPAAGAAAESRYYQPNVAWRSPDPASEGDVPVPAGGAQESVGFLGGAGGDQGPAVDAPPPGQRNWSMVPGAGMVAAGRPAVAPGGEQAPRGGGRFGHDFMASPDDSPPLPADEATAAASRLGIGTGVTNSSVTVDDRPGDRAHRLGDEETMPVTESDHDVGGQTGLSGASVSN